MAVTRPMHFNTTQPCEEENGSFIDLGWKYTSRGKKYFEGAEAISLGDWHSAEKQWDVCQIFVEDVAQAVGAKEVVLHDFFEYLLP